MDKPYDKSSKFLLKHHGSSILRLGGIAGVRACRAVQPEVVQPSQLPDGLLEADLEGRADPALTLVEIATFPERRVEEQMLRGALVVLLERRQLPEMLTLVLRPRGQYHVPSTQALQSPLGLTGLTLTWRVVELWTLPAQELLTAGDVGLIPWVPLTQFDGPPEVILQQCRERIDQQAPPQTHENLLAVTQVFTMLRYNDPGLIAIIGGRKTMIESPYLQEIVQERLQEVLQERLAERSHKHILRTLTRRFGPVPEDVSAELRVVQDESRLDDLLDWAHACPDLDAFRARLAAPPETNSPS